MVLRYLHAIGLRNIILYLAFTIEKQNPRFQEK